MSTSENKEKKGNIFFLLIIFLVLFIIAIFFLSYTLHKSPREVAREENCKDLGSCAPNVAYMNFENEDEFLVDGNIEASENITQRKGFYFSESGSDTLWRIRSDNTSALIIERFEMDEWVQKGFFGDSLTTDAIFITDIGEGITYLDPLLNRDVLMIERAGTFQGVDVGDYDHLLALTGNDIKFFYENETRTGFVNNISIHNLSTTNLVFKGAVRFTQSAIAQKLLINDTDVLFRYVVTNLNCTRQELLNGSLCVPTTIFRETCSDFEFEERDNTKCLNMSNNTWINFTDPWKVRKDSAFDIEIFFDRNVTVFGVNNPLLGFFPWLEQTSIIYKERNFIIDDGEGNVNITGNLNVNGNTTINLIYGEMYIHNSSGALVPIISKGVYENITMYMQEGEINGFNFSNGVLTTNVSGTYSINFQSSFSNGANTEYHLSLGVNGVQKDKCHSSRKLGPNGDVGSASFTCFYLLNQGDNITVMVENFDNTGDIVIQDLNLNLVRIGA